MITCCHLHTLWGKILQIQWHLQVSPDQKWDAFKEPGNQSCLQHDLTIMDKMFTEKRFLRRNRERCFISTSDDYSWLIINSVVSQPEYFFFLKAWNISELRVWREVTSNTFLTFCCDSRRDDSRNMEEEKRIKVKITVKLNKTFFKQNLNV